MLVKLVLASLWSRKSLAALTCLSIAISIFALISVEQIRAQVKDNFERTVSGVDLIVGSRTSGINLLLFSIFKIGQPSNNISWQSYQTLITDKNVAWSVPIVLGDSHRGYSVIGTTTDYFEHFKYAKNVALNFKKGAPFAQGYELVLGADVAAKLGYKLADKIVLSHGSGKVSFSQHDEHAFTVVGILAATGTPTDQSVYAPMYSIELLHQPYSAQPHSEHQTHEHEQQQSSLDKQLTPDVSAVLIGSKSRIGILSLQRTINQFKAEPLTAIMPLVALRELWQIVAIVETSLQVIAWLVLVTALICMTTMLLASMKERERELSVLRALGARASVIILLVAGEAMFLALIGAILGVLFASLTLFFAQTIFVTEFGLHIAPYISFSLIWPYLALTGVMAAGLSLVPALVAYKKSLLSGLSY